MSPLRGGEGRGGGTDDSSAGTVRGLSDTGVPVGREDERPWLSSLGLLPLPLELGLA